MRIRGDVAAQIEVLAGSERRPFANMVEVLLLAALTERGGNSPERRRVESVGSTPTTAPPRSVSAARTSYCVHKVPFNKKCEVCDA